MLYKNTLICQVSFTAGSPKGTGNPPLASRFDADLVVHCDSQLLLAAKINFRGLDRYMPEEKLDLIKFPSGQMTHRMNRYRSDMPGLPMEVGNEPVIFSELNT